MGESTKCDQLLNIAKAYALSINLLSCFQTSILSIFLMLKCLTLEAMVCILDQMLLTNRAQKFGFNLTIHLFNMAQNR